MVQNALLLLALGAVKQTLYSQKGMTFCIRYEYRYPTIIYVEPKRKEKLFWTELTNLRY